MNSKVIASLVMASVLGMSATVFAQDHGADHRGGRQAKQQSHEASLSRPGGPVPHQDWHKGDRLPADYRDRNYVVDDWRGHGLSAPPIADST